MFKINYQRFLRLLIKFDLLFIVYFIEFVCLEEVPGGGGTFLGSTVDDFPSTIFITFP